MKNSFVKKITTFSAKMICASLIACCGTQLAFADSTKPLPPTHCPPYNPVFRSDQCTLCNVISVLSTIHCKNTEMVYNILFAVDDWIKEKVVPTNTNLLQSQKDVKTAVDTSSSNLIEYYLAGVDVKEKNEFELGKTTAEDVSGLPPKYNDYAQYAFNSTEKNPRTAIMNTDTLLGPLQYDEQQKADAQHLISAIETIAPLPDIIHISNKFTIPYSPDAGKTTTIYLTDTQTSATAKLIPPKNATISKKTAKDLLDTLNTKPAYRKYRTNYRAALLTRIAMINNLLKVYQERVPLQPSGKSQAQLDYEAASWRLDPNSKYYDKMRDASPFVVERENLFLLSELRYELYQLRQLGEQMLTLQSLTALQTSTFSTTTITLQAQQIAKMIYCDAVDNTPCEKSPPSDVDAASIAESTKQEMATIPK